MTAVRFILMVLLFGAMEVESTAAAAAETCPLKITELNSYPWMIRRCSSQGDTSHCCEAVMDLLKILLYSWLHTTGVFLLPNERTAALCLDAVYNHFTENGVEKDAVLSCKPKPRNLVSSSEACNGIENLEAFEAAVDTMGMRTYCNGSRSGVYECNKCIQSMALTLNQLKKGDPGRAAFCSLFVMMYVGGAVNSFQDLGPDASYCLMGATNLAALAPTAAMWPQSVTVQVHKRSNAVKISLAVAVAVIVAMLVVVLVYGGLQWSKVYPRRIKLWRKHQLLRESVDAGTGLVCFGLHQIKSATGNFSASNVIGEGGFSTIYRGTLSDGAQIAVKKFKDFTTKGGADFRHEVQVISSVKHRNLLPLRGYCIDDDQQLLVYDFMANGSLADYLFRNKGFLSWTERRTIAVGIARGLAYLHEDAKPAIIHRDVKAANVLLDKDLNALVADFGLAKFKPDFDDNTHYTTRAVGTLGYVAPEYALYGHLTDKSDVFSFGIVLLEVISGRRALGSVTDNVNVDHILISDWACDLVRKGMSSEVIDKRIRDSGPKESMERMILLGLQCAHPRVACRPTISQAQTILEGIDRPLPQIILQSTKNNDDDNNNAAEETVKWLVSPDIDGRISYGSATLGNISMDSYSDGR